MILTCPACATQYTVKDGAIPPGGRQVRCAACKHSWHQDPEARTEASPAETAIAPPPPDPAAAEAPIAQIPEEAAASDMIAAEPQPALEETPTENFAPDDESRDAPAPGLGDYAPPAEALEAPLDDQADDGFSDFPAMDYDDEPPRHGQYPGHQNACPMPT